MKGDLSVVLSDIVLGPKLEVQGEIKMVVKLVAALVLSTAKSWVNLMVADLVEQWDKHLVDASVAQSGAVKVVIMV